jgi:hypothetical protein
MAALKRAFGSPMRRQSGLVPSIDMLDEDNARKGFSARQLQTLTHLPGYLHAVFRVAYITGWRVKGTAHVSMSTSNHGSSEDKADVPFTTDLREEFEKHCVTRRSTLERRIGRRVPWIFPGGRQAL